MTDWNRIASTKRILDNAFFASGVIYRAGECDWIHKEGVPYFCIRAAACSDIEATAQSSKSRATAKGHAISISMRTSPCFIIFAKMEKRDYVLYWKTTATKDWKRVNFLLRNRDYVFALFCAHLTLEKLIEAHWVKDNDENFPPRIHNLVRLAEQTKMKFSDEEKVFLRQMNNFQLEGRYPDYQALYRSYKSVATNKILARSNHIRKCLLKNLP